MGVIISIVRKMRRTRSGRNLYEGFLRVYHRIVQPLRCYRLRVVGARLICCLNDALKSADFECYAHWGTLLGIVREHDFIRSDDDLDFAVNRDSIRKNFALFVDQLIARGFVFSHCVRSGSELLSFTFKYKGVHVDFFCYEELPGGEEIRFRSPKELVNHKYANENQTGVHYIDMPRCRPGNIVEFKGVKVLIPTSPEKTLVRAYGDDWKVPNPRGKTPDDFHVVTDEIAERYADISFLLNG